MPVQNRLAKFKEVAVPLVTDVCQRAMRDAGVVPKNVHKLIVVSSTGFLGPSLDCELIESLGLPRSTDRTLIGFMGCAAAMNGYRVAMVSGELVIAMPSFVIASLCICTSHVW